MSTTETKIIKFKAVTEGFEKLYKDVQSAVGNQNIKLPESLQRSLIQYQNTIQNIQKLLSKGSDIGDSEFKDVEKMLSGLNSSARSFLDKFASFKLPPEVLKSFTSIGDELDSAQKKLRALIAGAAKYRGFIAKDEQGKDILTKKGYKEAFRQEFKPIDKKTLLTVKKGNGSKTFDNFDLLWEEAKSYDELNTKLNTYQQNVVNARNKIIELINAAKTDTGETYIDRFNERIESSIELVEKQQKVVNEARKKLDASTPAEVSPERNQDVIDTKKLYEQYYNTSQRFIDAQKEEATATETVIGLEENHNIALEKKNKTLLGTVTSAYAYHTVLNFIKNSIREAIQVITSMDKALTGMAVVTSMSREETWRLVGSFQSLAKETGKTTTEIASMATKFYQQGKNTREVLELTEAAAKAATIAGIDGAQSIDLLTNAMNGFQMSSSKAMEVSDKFAALAASSATDYEELATALSKVAAQANLAGMSMDFTLGMIAKGIEVTREAPETIGTALKTVISRMRELTDYGKTLEDNMDVNRVATALTNVGIDLMDRTTGQFRDLEQVFTEVGTKWDTLNKNQQANIAVAMAGTRQQSRFIAMMQDFDRTLELVNISSTSYGATLAQQAKYMEGMEAKVTLMKSAWEGLLNDFVNSDVIIWTIEQATSGIEFLNNNMWALYGIMGATLAIGAKHLIQTQIIKQAEFEISKQQNKQAIEEKELALERLALDKEQIIQKQIKADTVDEEAKLEEAISKEQIALEKKVSAQKMALLTEEQVQKQKAHIKELERLKEKAEVAGDVTQKEAAAKKILEAQQELLKLNEEQTTTKKELAEAEKTYLQAQQEREQAQANLNNAVEKSKKIAEEDYALKEKSTKLELQQLKLQKSQYDFSLRNILLIAKEIASGKLKLSSIKEQIKAKFSSKKAIDAETAAIKKNTEAQNKNTESNASNISSENLQQKERLESATTVSDVADVADSVDDVADSTKNASAGWAKFGSVALIALGAIIAVGGTIAAINWGTKKIQEYNNFIENTSENLEQLQVDLYNIKQESNNIKTLGDEFEELSKKVNTSADEAQRLNEIIEEINSTEGIEVIDRNADRSAQLAQIRGLQRIKEQEQKRIAQQMQFEINTGYGNAAFGEDLAVRTGAGATALAAGSVGVGAGVIGTGVALNSMVAGASAAAAFSSTIPVIGWVVALTAASVAAVAGVVALINKAQEEENKKRIQEYREFLTTSQVGQQTLRTIAQNNVEALENFSSSQSRELENIFIAMVADESNDALTLAGLQTDTFEAIIEANENYLNDFYRAENFTDMYKALEKMDETLLEYATESGSTLGALAIAGEDAAKAMDEMYISADNFMNLLNNIKSVMIEFELDSKIQQDVFSGVSKILSNKTTSEGGKLSDLTKLIEENIFMTQEQYDAAEKAITELENKTYKIGAKSYTEKELIDRKSVFEKEDKTSREAYTQIVKALTQAESERAAYEATIDTFKNQNKIKAELMSVLGDLIFPIEDANNFADALINITSASERLSKAMTDLNTMTMKEKLELLSDYTELATDILKGNLDAVSISAALAEKYNNELKKLERSENHLQEHLIAVQDIFNNPLTIESGKNAFTIDVSKLTGLNDISYEEAQKIITSGVTAEEIVVAQGKEFNDETALAQANDLLGYAKQILELGVTRQYMGDTYSKWLENNTKEERENFFNKQNQLKSEISLMKTRLSLLGETEEAEELNKDIMEKELQLIEDSEDLSLEGLKKKLIKAFGNEGVFNELLNSGVLEITENGLKRNIDAYDTLSEEAQQALSSFYSSAEDITEEWSKNVEDYYSNLETVMNDFISKAEEATEKENESLKKRKEAYEEYFDSIDALEEEQDRKQSREDIIRQISALSGGIGGTAKSKIKELQQQLNELNEEEAQAQKEAARQKVLDSIDKEIESNNEALDKNTAALRALAVATITGEDVMSNYYNTSSGEIDWEGILSKYAYSDGGYVSHTGLAYVHGSKQHPEAFLSAVDTANIRTLLDMYDTILNTSIEEVGRVNSEINETNSNTNVVVEKIEIHTEKLNNSQDFTSAGNALAKEFAKIIQQRGINVNAKK